MTAISPVRNNYVAVAATSTTTFASAGAYIHSVVVNVASNTEATVVVSDNGTELVRIPATQGSGERMRKPGDPGAPTAKAFRESAKTAKKENK